MALPFALFATIATMALAGAAVVSSIDVQRGSHRDSDAKSAIAAADAGAGVALMRLNRYADSLTNASNANCLRVGAEGTLAITGAVNGWCPAIQGSVGDSIYSYRVSAMVVGAPMSVVSTGTSGGVSRRVDVTLGAESVKKILEEEGLIGESGIKIPGNPHINVNVGTNGSIETSGNSWEICGNARHGIGQTGPTDEELCKGGEAGEAEVSLPPVSSFIPPDIKEENSNSRLMMCVTPEPVECQDDGYSGTRTETSPFNPATRRINLTKGYLSLGGTKPYWLCQLTLSGSAHLVMSRGSEVQIFFDTPEDCGMSSSEPQISLTGNTNIEATVEAELGEYAMPTIYMLGGPTSWVELHGTSGSDELILYAPDTNVKMQGNATYKGVIAGRTLEIGGNPTFEQDKGFESKHLPGSTLYSRQSYVECMGAAVSTPDENC